MAVKLERIGHVNLTVTDVERSKAFYSKVLGNDPLPPFATFPGAASQLGTWRHD